MANDESTSSNAGLQNSYEFINLHTYSPAVIGRVKLSWGLDRDFNVLNSSGSGYNDWEQREDGEDTQDKRLNHHLRDNNNMEMWK